MQHHLKSRLVLTYYRVVQTLYTIIHNSAEPANMQNAKVIPAIKSIIVLNIASPIDKSIID